MTTERRSDWTPKQLRGMRRQELIAALLCTEDHLNELIDCRVAARADDLRELARMRSWLEVYFAQIGELGKLLAQAEIQRQLTEADLVVERSCVRNLLQKLDDLKDDSK